VITNKWTELYGDMGWSKYLEGVKVFKWSDTHRGIPIHTDMPVLPPCIFSLKKAKSLNNKDLYKK